MDSAEWFEGELTLRFHSVAERERCYVLLSLAHPNIPIYENTAIDVVAATMPPGMLSGSVDSETAIFGKPTMLAETAFVVEKDLHSRKQEFTVKSLFHKTLQLRVLIHYINFDVLTRNPISTLMATFHLCKFREMRQS